MELTGNGTFTSDCGLYQYIKWQELKAEEGKVCTILGLSPTVALDGKPDQTTGICTEFATRLGYSKLVFVHLFALLSRGAEGLPVGVEPVGPSNDQWILEVAKNSDILIGAWGDYPGIGPRVRSVLNALKAFDIYCVQTNSNGSPRHPLAWRQKAPKLYRGRAPGAMPAAG